MALSLLICLDQEHCLMSYYKVIDGVRYDRELLEKAESLTKGRGDGRISLPDAQLIFQEANDRGILTAVEYNTVRYILDKLKVTTQAKEWLRAKMDQETPYQRIVSSIIREAFLLGDMEWEITEAEIQAQLQQFDHRYPFSLVLREVITAFIYSDETRTGLRSLVSIQFGIPLAEREQLTEKTKEVMNESKIFLFPVDYLNQIESGKLDFNRPYFYEPTNEHWTFGLKTEKIPGYDFLSFASRRYWYEVYNIGIN